MTVLEDKDIKENKDNFKGGLRDFSSGRNASEKNWFMSWRHILEQITGTNYSDFEPVFFSKQSVHGKGTNYSVKYKGDN